MVGPLIFFRWTFLVGFIDFTKHGFAWKLRLVGQFCINHTPFLLKFYIEILYLLRCEMGPCEMAFWFTFFGPWLFPISLVVWHLVKICQGEEEFHKFKTMARSRVLSTLSVLTKSSMQLVLQVIKHIIFIFTDLQSVYKNKLKSLKVAK